MQRSSVCRAGAALLASVALHSVRGWRRATSGSSSDLLDRPFEYPVRHSLSALLDTSSEYPVRNLIAPLAAEGAAREHGASAPGPHRLPSRPPAPGHHRLRSRPAFPVRGRALSLFEGGRDEPDGRKNSVLDGGSEASQDDIDDESLRFLKEEPRLVPFDVIDLEGELTDVYMPVDWASKLVPDDMEFFAPPDPLILARTQGEPSREVMLAILNPSDEMDRRLLAMMKRLRDAPNVINYLDSHEFPDRAFLMTEFVKDDSSLAEYNNKAASTIVRELVKEGSSVTVYNKLAPSTLPLRQALPILVDILYAVVGLDRAGVIHPWLAEDVIHFSSEGRVLVSDFAGMCSVDASDEFGPDSVTELPGSALRTAPEMVDGRPTGPSNTMWAVGMIFGRMCLGAVPTFEAVEAELGMKGEDVERALILFPNDAEKARELIRTKFDVGQHSRFEGLADDGVKQLLVGMLDTRPDDRWSAERALSYAVQLADEQGIELFAPREPLRLPGE